MQCQILLWKLQISVLGDKHVPENHIIFDEINLSVTDQNF